MEIQAKNLISGDANIVGTNQIKKFSTIMVGAKKHTMVLIAPHITDKPIPMEQKQQKEMIQS